MTWVGCLEGTEGGVGPAEAQGEMKGTEGVREGDVDLRPGGGTRAELWRGGGNLRGGSGGSRTGESNGGALITNGLLLLLGDCLGKAVVRVNNVLSLMSKESRP